MKRNSGTVIYNPNMVVKEPVHLIIYYGNAEPD